MDRTIARRFAAAAWLLLSACAGPVEPPAATAPPAAESPPAETAADAGPPFPPELQTCFACHAEQVLAFAQHGMSASVGRVGGGAGLPEPGEIANPESGNRYEIRRRGGDAWLDGRSRDGGLRSQRLVGRIGAGVYDVSWIGTEVDPVSGRETGRLFFAPVETVTGHGLALSPFDLYPGSPGLDMALAEGCLTCHTDTEPESLAEAAVSPDGRHVYPANHLGSDAFAELAPLSCGACHGDTSRHRAIVTGEAEPGPDGDLGIVRWADLSTRQRRDVCARCHLQGEARIDLVDHRPSREQPLAAQIPVLVPSRPWTGHRFVGQVEQLGRSECFEQSPEMTCATCHEPHTGVAEQGTASFETACLACHGDRAEPHAGGLSVEQVAGRPARTERGCVDCHVAYAQPIDLPHVVTADHFIRARLPAPEEVRAEVPHRQFLDPAGPMEIHDDGRLAPLWRTPAGERWRDGVRAMGLVSMSRFAEAAKGFSGFPAPGTPAAREPSAPAGLVPLETYPSFHHLRALTLQSQGDLNAALAAFGDALELDPDNAAARIDRAQLLLVAGDRAAVIEETERVIQAHPQAERPWLLRAQVALSLGRPDMARQATETAVEIWPSSAAAWYQLAELRRLTGDSTGAEEALARGRALQPSGPPRPPGLEVQPPAM